MDVQPMQIRSMSRVKDSRACVAWRGKVRACGHHPAVACYGFRGAAAALSNYRFFVTADHLAQGEALTGVGFAAGG